MTDDAGKGGEWVTGVIGPAFQVDKDGNPIPGSEEQPTGEPDPEAVRKAIEEAMGGLGTGAGNLMPTGILPAGSGEIGGNDDETQKEIWAEMERGEYGADAGKIPEDAETSI